MSEESGAPRPFTDRPDDLTVGVLGGMGPRATVDFFGQLVSFTEAGKDWNHLHIMVENNPRIPSRSRAWALHEQSPAPWMVAGARRLVAAGAQLIAVPCNSAAQYLGPARAAVSVPILDPVDATARAILAAGAAGARRVTRPFVMGGAVTFGARLYDAALAPGEVTPLWPEGGEQEEVQALIEALKSEDRIPEVTARAARLITAAAARGADGAVLGCTEFGMIADRLPAALSGAGGLPVFNSNALLAQLVVRIARREQPAG
jgi:aspartate racemase